MDKGFGNGSLSHTSVRITAESIDMSILRVQRDGADVAERLGDAFHMDWPSTPNTVAGIHPRVIWLAPGEWAILQPGNRVQAVIDDACSGHLHHLSDVSAGHRLWRIEGAESRTIVGRGCSIDTHPRVFAPGCCARTLFAQVPVILVAATSIGSFEIVADASFEGHLQAWFTDALQGFA